MAASVDPETQYKATQLVREVTAMITVQCLVARNNREVQAWHATQQTQAENEDNRGQFHWE
jgi:hypothetical protein